MKPDPGIARMEEDQATAKVWFYTIGVMGLFFLVASVTVLFTRKPGDDWLAVILPIALLGLCAFAELVLAVLYIRNRHDLARYKKEIGYR